MGTRRDDAQDVEEAKGVTSRIECAQNRAQVCHISHEGLLALGQLDVELTKELLITSGEVSDQLNQTI